MLGSVLDLERLTARVAMERAHAKDLLAIASSLEAVLAIGDAPLRGRAATPCQDPLPGPRRRKMRDLAELLAGQSARSRPSLLNEGNLIRRGYDAELDRLHELKDNARGILERYLEEERAATGIGSLKLRYNRIIGYYFEVTKSNLSSRASALHPAPVPGGRGALHHGPARGPGVGDQRRLGKNRGDRKDAVPPGARTR